MTAGRNDQTASAGGTFGGVFTPSILTILGLVLFLRVAYVVGSVGLVQALVILALATSVSVLTSISLATVATNMRLQGGGEYFLISRTLGIEFGGAVGVVLYLAISVSIAFYSIGFSEAVVAAFDRDSAFLVQLVAAGVVVVLGAIAAVGSDLATRLQYVVMALLVLALASFFWGGGKRFRPVDPGRQHRQTGERGRILGSVRHLLPGGHRIQPGCCHVGRSPVAELVDDSRHVRCGRSLDTRVPGGHGPVGRRLPGRHVGGRDHDHHGRPVTRRMDDDHRRAGGHALLGVGLESRRFPGPPTSGGGSGASPPRSLLQGFGPGQQPAPGPPRLGFHRPGDRGRRRPQRHCAGHLDVLPGQLRHHQLRHLLRDPGRQHLVSTPFPLVRRPPEPCRDDRLRRRHRGDQPTGRRTGRCGVPGPVQLPAESRRPGSLGRQRRLAALRRGPQPPACPRQRAGRPPQLASLHPGVRHSRPDATGPAHHVASWLEGDSGFITAVRLIEGTGLVLRRQAAEIEADLSDEVDDVAPGAFARVLVVGDAETGVQGLVQAHGLGPVRPNITVFGVRDLQGTDDEQKLYGTMLQNCVRLNTNVAVVNVRDDAWQRFEATPPAQRSIALWWSDDQVGQLITLLGWLCQRHAEWSDASIVVYVPQSDEEGETVRVAEVLEAARISAEVREVEPAPATFTEALSSATMAFAPLRVHRGAAIGPFGTSLGMLVESLPLAVLVLATETIDLGAEADDHDLAELARSMDAAEEGRKRVAELDAEAASLLVETEALRLELEDGDGAGEQDRKALEQRYEELERRSAAAYRKYVDAKTRSMRLEKQVDELSSNGSGSSVDPGIWRSSSRSQG